MVLKITNTITGKKQDFKSLEPNKVSMYVCGITPYDHSHIGHGRCYVAFDVLYRTLRFLGYEVLYCRNITDIDDKLINKAQEQLGDKYAYPTLAEKYIKSYHADMLALNCVSPKYEPRVTKNISYIIDFIVELIDNGYAYEADGDVYFDISQFDQYGKLSNRNVANLRSGVRVDIEKNKKDPLDFALWKREAANTFWASPWGYGRPGWHIECSALAAKYLGDHIDIHGGGLDLVFPHHENEIAQSEALHKKPLARYWMHNGLVTINKEKMSKSLGNVLFLHNLFTTFDPMVIRFYFLNHHYRAPLNFSLDDIYSIQKSYQRLAHLFKECECKQSGIATLSDIGDVPVLKRIITFLLDDLNTVGLIGVLFEHAQELSQDKNLLCVVKRFLHDVLGLTFEPLAEKKVAITPEIRALLEARKKARAQKDWSRADDIRDKLRKLDFQVSDKKTD